jgi:uncharacterized SAM-binding protein YcdF (DUF218 family)
MEKKHPRKHWEKIFSLLLVILLAYLILTAVSIISYSEKDETRAADAAIVLGASVYDNSPSPVFCERINHAVELYNDGYVKAIIMTGGVGEGNIRSEADIAREYAEQQGVPADAIYKEEESAVTIENIRNAKVLMEQNEMDTALIVSDPLHMKRAMIYAEDIGMEAYSSPTPTSLYRSWKTKLPFLLREEFFYIVYRLIRPF